MTRVTQRFDVVIEVPRYSFVKRGAGQAVEFISPVPCPFNYGSIPTRVGRDRDLLDAVVVGPRLARGQRVAVTAQEAVGFTDDGISDDKMICGPKPIGPVNRHLILGFFHFYAVCKRLLNRCHGRTGRTACEGWVDVGSALSRTDRCEEVPGRTV